MAGEPDKVIIEKSRNNSMTTLIALLLLALVAVGVYALVQHENRKDDTIAGAAQKVGDAAEDVGDATKDAVNK